MKQNIQATTFLTQKSQISNTYDMPALVRVRLYGKETDEEGAKEQHN